MRASNRLPNQYDFVIVGAGSAGCALANRLTRNSNHHVLLIEAGKADNSPLIHMPIGFSRLMYDPKDTDVYFTEPEVECNNRRIHSPRGRVLGGCSSINGMVYIRGQKEDYDEWAKQPGCQGWSYEDVLPYFKRSENFAPEADAPETKIDMKYHSSGGDLDVTYSRTNYALGETYINAAREAGIPYNPDFNGAEQEGIGYFQLNQRQGKRWSSARAFLGIAAERPNLTIATSCKATKILFHHQRAIGVEYRTDKGAVVQAAAMSEVILCAGTFATPQLLELSGIGQREVLEKHGIAPVKELRGVGENLQDHYTIIVQHGIKEGETLSRDGQFPRVIWSVLKYLFARRGVLAHPAATIGAFIKGTQKDGSRDTRPAYQIHFAAGNGDWDDKGNMMPGENPGVTSTCCVLRPESRGSVHIQSTDPWLWPAVRANYLSTVEDRRRIVEAVKLQRQIYAAPSFAAIATEEEKPGAAVQSDEQILDYCRNNGMSVYHPVGTCRMGAVDDPLAVVDHRFKVHGVEALRIVDGSVLPNLLSGNTHAPIVMMAERATDFIIEDKLAAEQEAFRGLPPKGVDTSASGGGKCPFR